MPRSSSPRAEAAEAAGRHAEAAALYGRCLALDPGDSVAAFNRANCLRADGRAGRGGARASAGAEARPGLRRGLVQPRRPGRGARPARRGAAAPGAGARARPRLRRRGLQPRLARLRGRRRSTRRGAGGRAISSSTTTSDWARTRGARHPFRRPRARQRSGRLSVAVRPSCSTGRRTPRPTVLLAHGAGAPMDSAAMTAAARRWRRRAARRPLRVRLHGGAAHGGRPQAAAAGRERDAEYAGRGRRRCGAAARLVIGGKSMGGRVASMVADALHAEGRVAGLLCLGYPFHPPGRPEQLRTGASGAAARRRR